VRAVGRVLVEQLGKHPRLHIIQRRRCDSSAANLASLQPNMFVRVEDRAVPEVR
jgi:hypothetical protein